jgi:hypothetical protein
MPWEAITYPDPEIEAALMRPNYLGKKLSWSAKKICCAQSWMRSTPKSCRCDRARPDVLEMGDKAINDSRKNPTIRWRSGCAC